MSILLHFGLVVSSASSFSDQPNKRGKTYKVSTEDVLHFLGSGQQAPSAFSDLDKLQCKLPLHIQYEFLEKFCLKRFVWYILVITSSISSYTQVSKIQHIIH